MRGAIGQFPSLLEQSSPDRHATQIVIAHRGAPAALEGMGQIRCNPDADASGICQVWFDDAAIGQQAAAYLAGSGCCRALVFAGQAKAHPAYRLTREAAFARRFNELGGSCDLLQTPRDRGVDGALAWRRERLASMPRPLACFAYQDNEACYVGADLQRIGLRIGADVALLSCQDTPVALGFDPPMSSVRVSWRLVGEAAARQAHSLVTGGACAPQVLIKPLGIATRASTVCRHDPLVERAEVLIRKALPRGLRVAQLAHRLGVSPVTLGRRYRHELGVDPCSCLRWQRLIEAQTALADVDGASIDAIAKRGGWWSRQHFTTDFRRAFGTTPARFRAGRESTS